MSARPPAIEAWEAADRRQDLSVMERQLAPDVRLISPLTDTFTFDGPTEVMAVFASAFELLRDLVVYKVTGADQDWVLYGKNTLQGRNLEEIQWLHLNTEGLIDEITLFIRPVTAAVTLLSRIGPPLARRGLMDNRWAAASAVLGRMPAAQLLSAERLIMPRLRRPGD